MRNFKRTIHLYNADLDSPNLLFKGILLNIFEMASCILFSTSDPFPVWNTADLIHIVSYH